MASLENPHTEQHIESMFDRIAPRYDLLNRLLSARQDQRWRGHMMRRVPTRPQGTIVDVATGTGDVLAAASKSHPEYSAFVGVDISREMLTRAQTKLAPLGASLTLRQMSAERLDLADDMADCLTISFGLRNVINRRRALEEFHRVLRSRGRLMILEFFLPERGPGAWLFQLYFHHILPAIGGLLSDRKAYKYLPESVGNFYKSEALRKELQDVGFTVVEEKKFLFGACRLFVADKTI